MDIRRLADKLRSQNFAPNDSVILSTINHPLTAAQKGVDWFAGQVNRAANIPEQYDNPNPLAGYAPEQQVGGALNLAGLMQTSAFPFAPKGAGNLGTVKALELYHGGRTAVPSIKREGIFDGLFASTDKHAALSHGDVLSKYYVNQNKIGDDFGQHYDKTIDLIKRFYPDATDDDIDNILYPAIAEDVSPFKMNESDVLRLTGQPDLGEASWALQADRGRIGKLLGYDAVKMNDEHGTSYILPFGSKAKYRGK